MHYLLLIFVIIYPYFLNPFHTNQSLDKFNLLLYFTVVLWVLIMLMLIKREKQYFTDKVTRVELYLLIYGCLITLSTLFSVDLFTAIFGERRRYEGYISLISYLSLLFFTYRFVSKKHIYLFIHAIVFNGILIGLYGILQHYQIDPIKRADFQLNWRRSFGFFGNPNFFGSYIALTLPFSIATFLRSEKRWVTIISFLSSTFLFTALLYSETRSGWLGAFIGYALIFVVFVFKNKSLWIRWISLSLVFLSIFVALNIRSETQYTKRIDQTFEQVSKDVNRGGSGRIYIWRKSLTLLDDSPLLGTGPDTFAYAFMNGTEEDTDFFHGVIVDKAHNEYIQIAITLGIPALIIYLLILFEIVKTIHNKRKHFTSNEYDIAYILLIAIASYLIQAFFNISVVPVAPFFWVILGLAYVIGKKQQ